MTDDQALKTWPERIFLQHSEDGYPVPEYKVDTDEITWEAKRIFDCDVEYVRADLQPVAQDVPEADCGNMAQDSLAEQYNDVLRELACYVSAGGYNSDGMIDPKVALKKIMSGIDSIRKVESEIAIGGLTLDQEKKAFLEWAENNEYLIGELDHAPLFSTWLARAALQQPAKAPVAPNGWKLVPIEPTNEMMNAAYAGIQPDSSPHTQKLRMRNAKFNYIAMLNAAPAPDMYAQSTRSANVSINGDLSDTSKVAQLDFDSMLKAAHQSVIKAAPEVTK